MELKPITDDKTYQQFLNWIDAQLDKNINSGTSKGQKLKAALLLVKQYEDEKFSFH
ncbi:MAG: hypothetical protein RL708_1066 [Bacteroidota bacterium]|jgi:antitoxin component HigA of HigAB toxin-antitoxin module